MVGGCLESVWCGGSFRRGGGCWERFFPGLEALALLRAPGLVTRLHAIKDDVEVCGEGDQVERQLEVHKVLRGPGFQGRRKEASASEPPTCRIQAACFASHAHAPTAGSLGPCVHVPECWCACVLACLRNPLILTHHQRGTLGSPPVPKTTAPPPPRHARHDGAPFG